MTPCPSYRRRPASRNLFVMPVQTGIHNPLRHTGADRYPETSSSCRRRPVSRNLFVMPVQTGIHNPLRHTGEGRYPVLFIPGSRLSPGRRGGDSLFISGFTPNTLKGTIQSTTCRDWELSPKGNASGQQRCF